MITSHECDGEASLTAVNDGGNTNTMQLVLSISTPKSLFLYWFGEIKFPIWRRKFKDYGEAQSKPLSDEEKANQLKFSLSDFVYEKFEAFNGKYDCRETVKKLKKLFRQKNAKFAR